MKIKKIVFPNDYYVPRYYQLPVFKAIDSGIKRIVQCWSRQLGKDTTDFLVMVKQAMSHPGNYFYVFPTRESAKKAVWEKIDRDGQPLMKCIPESRLLKKSDVEMYIKLRSGVKGNDESTIRFVGLDYNPDSIRGITPRGIVFSEFAYQDSEVYKTILPALQQYPDAWVIYNSTPNGKNHFFELWERVHFNDGGHATGWFTSYHQVLYPEREGYVPPDISGITVDMIRTMQLEAGLTDEFIEQEFGCSFDIGMRGSIYNECIEEAKKGKRIIPLAYNRYKRVDTFWDLGISDPTCIWFRQMEGTKEMFFDYVEVTNKDYEEVVEILKEKGYRYNTHFLPHDGNQTVQQTGLTDAEFIEDILRDKQVTGTVEVCPKLPKKTTINAIRALFGRFYFDPEKCYAGLKAVISYHYKYDKKKKTYMNEPYDDWSSHACDALGTRVAAMSIFDEMDRETNPYLKEGRNIQDFDPLDF